MSEFITLPYLVDPHVHARTPGQSYKESFGSLSRAAIAGGVLAVMDMPNNVELVTTRAQVQRKRDLALMEAVCDVGFHLGTLGDESQRFDESYHDVLGLKVYMDETTGGYVVTDPQKLDSIFRRWEGTVTKPILAHAEGNTLGRALDLAAKYNRVLYACHLNSAKEVQMIREAKEFGLSVFAEVTPHHLLLDSRTSHDPNHQMKPPLSSLEDQDALWEGLRDGTIDVVGTDHAPHTPEEKRSAKPPSGVTGLQTMLPLLLSAEREGKISLDRIREVTHDNPLRIFNIEEQPESYVVVERGVTHTITNQEMFSRSRLTPFDGREVYDRVQAVILRGQIVYEDGKVLAPAGSGRILYTAA